MIVMKNCFFINFTSYFFIFTVNLEIIVVHEQL